MALSTTQYGYIIDPMVPFTDDKGKTIKNGFVRVFVAGSSTPVVTYRNFDGAANQYLIELDNSGRTKTSVIGSKGLTYKVCVYDKHHSQESPILTVDKVSVIGANITAGTGATVVTGLDGLTTKPDGFVDASVVGTDGYVALDHTLVTDDLDTDAKVTAVEEDRYIPLLNEDVNDPDSKMTLGRLWQWVLGKISNIATTITAFRQGDVIPVDGPSGTAKMSKDDLLAVTAENALGSIHSLSDTATDGYLSVDNDTIGPSKMHTSVIFNNFAGKFIANTTRTIRGLLYLYDGVVYVAKENNYQGPWDSSKFKVSNLSSAIIDFLGEHLCYEFTKAVPESSSVGFGINADGSIIYSSNYRVDRYAVTIGELIKVITPGKFRFSASASINDMFGDVYESGICVVPEGASYVIVSALTVETTNFGIGSKPTELDRIGFKELSLQYEAVSLASSTDGYRIASNGSLVLDADYRIDRYAVTAGATVKVITTDKFRFSTSISASDMVDSIHESGIYSVPTGVSYAIVSTPKTDVTECGVGAKPKYLTDGIGSIHSLQDSATESNFTESNYFALDSANGPRKLSADTILKCISLQYNSVPLFSSTDGYRIAPNGTFVSDNDYKVDRYAVTADDLIKVITEDRFRFSTSASINDMFGNVYESGICVVPANANYVIVSTPKNRLTTCGVGQKPSIGSVADEGGQWVGKKWYAYGTSITAPLNGRYFGYLEQMSGMDGENKGIGGGGIGDLGGHSHGQVFDAICNTDDGKTDADLITLETGANDTGADVPLGTIYDTTQDTLAGCLNLCIRYLQTNTNAQIAIMPSVATTSVPNAGDKYYEWQMMIRDICFINRVYFIDPACNLGYAKLISPNGSLYVRDTIHQTELGGYILAENMWRQIKNIPLFKTAL